MLRILFALICTLVLLPAAGTARTATGPDSLSCPPSLRYLYWTGEADNDFFNEKNWRFALQNILREADSTARGMSVTEWLEQPSYKLWLGDHTAPNNINPRPGTLEPGQPIRFNLYVADAQPRADGAVTFGCDARGVTLHNARLTSEAPLVNGVYSLDDRSTLYLRAAVTDYTGWRVNLLDARSWVYFYANDPVALGTAGAGNILVGDSAGEGGTTYRLDQYYQSGTVLRKIDPAYTPLTVYAGGGGQGASGGCTEQTIYRAGTIPAGLDNNISSFRLERGYQAVFAIEANGTSMSKVYIASEEDLVIDELPAALNDNDSFIRVMPWEWITKKGTGGYFPGLDAGWYYNWGLGNDSEPNYHYVPMAWGAGGAMPRGVARLIGKSDVNHLLGFNESDNCEDQSGQYNNLCDPEVAVAYFENLMGTGLRLGTPAPRENGPFGWLDEFSEIARQRNVRFDFVAVHWYDWGSNPRNSPNAPATEIFERFKNYLHSVHDKYQLPIWITEFNANPNRGNAIQDEFLRLALPYLDSLDYIERYAYFQPDPRNSSTPNEPAYYYDANGNLTNIGEIYRNHPSTPSIPEPTYAAPNNLDGLERPYVERQPELLTFEAECAAIIGNQVATATDEAASNGVYVKLDAGQEGAKDLARQLQFEFELDEAATYRMWIRYRSATSANTALRFIVDGAEQVQNIGGLNRSDWGWEQLPRYLDLEAGKHRITVQFTNPLMLLDAVAFVSGSGEVGPSPLSAGSCTPPDTRWGAVQTDTTYLREAEDADPLGADWQIGSSPYAINEAYISAAASATDIPPGAAGSAVFTFDVAESDEYLLWAKVQALTQESDALWIRIDDGSYFKWDDLMSDVFLWRWAQVQEIAGGSLGYFLTAGTHTVTFAYCEGGTRVDRVALSSVGRSPATADPNVVFPNLVLDFEAENATLVGNNALSTCDQASNGQMVKPGNAPSNAIRFTGIGIREPGTYVLSVDYLSANSRKFGVVVNGERLPIQTVASSGAWCFAGGETATYQMDIALIAGENTVEITGAWTDAPFIDKIFLDKKEVATSDYEAEDALLTGSATVQNCGTASNGAYVNTFEWAGNSIEFTNVSVAEAGSYRLDIDYVSKNERKMTLLVNGAEVALLTFPSSGEWCFNGGGTATFSFTVDLLAGDNRVTLRNADQPAPLVDKISVVPTATDAALADPVDLRSAVTKVTGDFTLYPNPVYEGSTVTLTLPETLAQPVTRVTLSDITTGRQVEITRFSAEGGSVRFDAIAPRGHYLVTLTDADRAHLVTKRLFIH